MGGRKNIKQEKDEGSRKVSDIVEGFYSGRRHLGKKGKSKKYRRIDRGVRKGRNGSQITGGRRKGI